MKKILGPFGKLQVGEVGYWCGLVFSVFGIEIIAGEGRVKGTVIGSTSRDLTEKDYDVDLKLENCRRITRVYK